MRTSVPGWAWFLGVGLLVAAPYPWLAPGLLQQCWYDGIAVVGTAAMAVGTRRNRPEQPAAWWLLVVGQGANVVGDVLYFMLPDRPSPAPYDLPYLLSYFLVAFGLLLLLRRRNRGGDRANLVDSLLVATAFALLTWVFLMKPVVGDRSMALPAQLITLSYPTLDLLLLALLAWLLTTDGVRNVSFVLVAVNMAAFLGGDYVWAFADHALYNPGNLGSRLIDCTYLVAYLCFGAGALHPGMAEIGRPVDLDRVRPVSVRRLVLLAGATLIAPALLAWQAYRGGGRVPDAYPIVLGCVTMFLLVVARMTMLVRQVHAQARVLADQADRLREVAERDPLTGLPNRRAWNAELPSALRRAARDAAPLSLAVLDLDHFKAFNDTYGHQAGDRLLEETAATWVANLRAVDLVARYGGEEFVALLPGATEAEAVALLDRLRPLTPMGCTFSAGVATWNGLESADELVARADRAMYRAKDAGRNRVEAALT
ncbi:GGDEF domain-containing protein [Planosporangium mesophilum]|uniref:GGDEF domain-containing protein n=1 Tax=Planosporangium mesophilum TaxID=689768 RepID=A0A8J3X093_9ACTN|nr:GGDEF domain-containing protein [Planosporangium mesophilum]NJC83601.1 GGDEF domain-containing protein [Planosporangium mesophilum]GII22114.1 hypothetical protein Pme01_17110 [Planosporangium mesophilum]